MMFFSLSRERKVCYSCSIPPVSSCLFFVFRSLSKAFEQLIAFKSFNFVAIFQPFIYVYYLLDWDILSPNYISIEVISLAAFIFYLYPLNSVFSVTPSNCSLYSIFCSCFSYSPMIVLLNFSSLAR